MENVARPYIWGAVEFLTGPLQGKTFPISKPTTIIGCDPSCTDVTIADPSILRQHAKLVWSNGYWQIEKLDRRSVLGLGNQHSQQLVLLNEQRAVLSDKDIVGLGSSGIIFRFFVNTTPPSIPIPPPLQTVPVSSDVPVSPPLPASPMPSPSQALGHVENLSYTPTTRYLCAAAYLDKNFRNYVIKQLVEEEYRAIGESIGVDLVLVAKYCLTARQEEFRLDLILAAILLISFIPFLWIIGLPVAWFLIARELWMTHYKAIGKRFNRTWFGREAMNVSIDQRVEQKIREATSNVSNSNVVIYSGFSPFIGTGVEIGGWSFALNVEQGKEEVGTGDVLQPISFAIRELYDCVTNAVSELRLGELSMRDRLYVNGQTIQNDTRFLRDKFARPYVQVHPELVEKFMEHPLESIRYYKSIQVTSWKGELVLSIFLRFVRKGPHMFTEVNYCVLPPLKDDYHKIDTAQPILTLKRVGELAGLSLLALPIRWWLSPFRVLSTLSERWQAQSERATIRQELEENPNFDYGASISIREYASSSTYQQYFQIIDKEMYIKIIQSHVLEAIIDFLDSKNIDTTELKERQTTILNSGVIMSGSSTINAGALGVGTQAQAGFFGAVGQATRTALGGTQQETAKKL